MQKMEMPAFAGSCGMRVDRSIPNRGIPLVVKLVYTGFVAGHLLLNLRFYGPMNYLWLCDIAVLMAFIAMWTQSSLLLGMSAIGLFGPSGLWVIDLLWKVVTHHGGLGMADYMLDARYPVALRLGSTFHLWLPILMLYCFYRIGYDRRALFWQTLLAIVVLILSRTLGPPPPEHDVHDVVNINCAYGTSGLAPQTKLPAALYLCKLIVKSWVGMYLPTHLLLIWMFGKRPAVKVGARNVEAQREGNSKYKFEASGGNSNDEIRMTNQ